jgi:hypothetical protein
MLGEGAAETPNRVLPAFAGGQSAGDRVVTHTRIALLVRREKGEQVVKAERFFRVSAKVPLVTRQSSPPASLSIVSV